MRAIIACCMCKAVLKGSLAAPGQALLTWHSRTELGTAPPAFFLGPPRPGRAGARSPSAAALRRSAMADMSCSWHLYASVVVVEHQLVITRCCNTAGCSMRAVRERQACNA